MLSVLDVYFQNEPYKVYPHPVNQVEEPKPIRVVISGASNKCAVSLSLGLVKGNVFGNQTPIILVLFDVSSIRFRYVIALASQLALSGYGLLRDVIPTRQASVAFKEFDWLILINPERTTTLGINKVNYYFQLYKNLGNLINEKADEKTRIVIAGEMTAECAMMLVQYAPKVSVENITGLSRHIAARSYNIIAANMKEKFKNICGVHVWGVNHTDLCEATVQELKDGTTPETRFFTKIGHETINMYTAVRDGVLEEMKLSHGVENMTWTKHAVTEEAEFYKERSNDHWIGTAICSHIKDWCRGTLRSVSMVVCSDGSHDVPYGMFLSFPVKIDSNGKWSIIKKIKIDPHTAGQIKRDVNHMNMIKTQIMTYACREDLKVLIETYLKENNKENNN